MIEAYKIGTTFVLNDLVAPKLLELSKQFLKLEQQTVALNKEFKSLGREGSGIRIAANAAKQLDHNLLLASAHTKRLAADLETLKRAGGLNDKTRGLHGEFAKAQASAQALGASLAMISGEAEGIRAVARSAEALADYLKKASAHSTNLHSQLSQIRAMGALPQMPTLPGGGGGRRGGGGGGRHGGLHGGNIHVGPNGFGVGSVGMGGIIGDAGLVGLAAGYGAYAFGKASVEEASEYQRQQAHFSLFGMSPTQNAEAKRYVETLNAPGASMVDKMRYFTEAQGVFRESGMQGDEALMAAKVMTPILAQMHYASALTDHPMDAQQEKAMLRFIEISGGLKSTKRAAELADLGFRTTVTSGGVVDWEQLRQARAIGGVSVKNMSDEAFFGWSEPIINELKGSGFGTGMMTAYNRLNGINKLTKQQLHEFLTLGGNADDLKKDMKVGGKDAGELVKLGIWDPSKVAFNKAGGVDHYNGNPLKWADERAANPLKWHIDHVMPAYDRMGLSQGDRDRENAILYGTTGAKIFSLLEQQMERVIGGVGAWKQAHGLPEAVKATDATMTGQEQQFNAAWGDFKNVFGETILPQATAMLKGGTEMLKGAQSFIKDNSKEWAEISGGFGKLLSHPIDGAKEIGHGAWTIWNRGVEKQAGIDAAHWAEVDKADKTVSPGAKSTPMKAEINVHLDSKKISTEVASVVFKPMRGGAPLGSGMFDPSFGHPSTLNGY